MYDGHQTEIWHILGQKLHECIQGLVLSFMFTNK